MTLINLEGEREAKTLSSYEYGEKIIEYLQLRDYYLIKDSNIDGIFQDKIFRRPKFDGVRETVLEVKYTELGLRDEDFLKEFAKYYILYMRQKEQNRFYFKVYARKLKNIEKWKDIFDEIKLLDTEIIGFKKRIEDILDDTTKSTFLSYSNEEFNDFLSDCEVVQAGHDRLIQEIEYLKNSKKFDTTEEYLIEKPHLIYEPETLTGNLVKVEKFPDEIFIGGIDYSKDFGNFWGRPDADQYVPYKNVLFSTKPFPDSIVENYLFSYSCAKANLSEYILDEEDLLNLKKKIIKSFIISKGSLVGCWFNRRADCLFFPHFNPHQNIQKIDGKSGHKRRIISRVYVKHDRLNFVVHRALKFRVTDMNNELYIIFNSFRLFTEDGRKIIVGDNAKKLHYSFPPNKAFNNIEKSKLDFLVTLLDLRTRDWYHPSFIVTSEPIELIVPCHSISTQIFEEEDNHEGTLFDFEELEDDF
ncbi:hypothetical protein METP3_01207 [Methanosarcinales archaeon]|nr:MAG: hypothetical protein OI861_00260 [Candidatus Methanoperedens sp.]CAG0966978.1 hypothetical protein METP3_01207 [Methanosarcinales archaeon]